MPLDTPVTLHTYDPQWSVKFAAEQNLLQRAAGALLTHIEHIGSTAIPGMTAKPTIDILAAIISLTETNQLIAAVASLGYIYEPRYETDLPNRRYFYKGRHSEDEFHLHVVEFGTPFWVRHMAFRDYLRNHPDEANEYAQLKIGLAAKYQTDRDSYTDSKGDFIRRIESLAGVSSDN